MLGLGVARPDLSDYRGHLILSPCQGLDPPLQMDPWVRGARAIQDPHALLPCLAA